MRVSKYEMDGHANANENAKLQFFLKNKASFAVCCCFSWNSHVHIQQDEGLMTNKFAQSLKTIQLYIKWRVSGMDMSTYILL